MLRLIRIESVRGRLTLFWVCVLAVALLAVGGLIYVLLARVLYSRIDDNLRAFLQIATSSLERELDAGYTLDEAARRTTTALASRRQMIAVFDAGGAVVAESGRDDDLEFELSALATPAGGEVVLQTLVERDDDDDRHRLASRRIISPGVRGGVLVVGSPLERTDEELESLREILAYVVPLALLVAGGGGYFLARQSLAPVGLMANRARQIGAADLGARLPVANPRDELGRLAASFNGLLGRLEASLAQQRQFMADASHELRTPVATARTAAAVALQRPHRDEAEYRETLEVIEQQMGRLSRVVDDMFTLARADTGRYPVRTGEMYLDEVIDDTVRAARVMAAVKEVRIESAAGAAAAFTGDEELIRRLLANLLDNAVRHAPAGSVVRVSLAAHDAGYLVSIRDEGPGIPPEAQPHLFERFFRVDTARTSDGGAGLGLALARWIARLHGGDVRLEHSSPAGSTFVAVLASARDSSSVHRAPDSLA